ncbi:hypothetical protein [Streptomyces griseus]
MSELGRELRAAFAGEIGALRDNGLADLKTSQQETRASAYNAGKRASEAVHAVTDLRRDVDRLHGELEGLRRDVGEVLALLHAGAPPAVDSEAGDGLRGELGPLSDQRKKGEEEGDAAGDGDSAEVGFLVGSEPEQPQDDELAAVTEEEPVSDAAAAPGADSPEDWWRRGAVRCG